MENLEHKVCALIGTDASLQDVLDTLILGVEERDPKVLGSVLSLEDGDTLRHLSSPRLSKTYRETVDGQKIGPAAGSCGTACYRRERVVVSDILTDPLWAEYKDFAASENLRACWSQPIISSKNQVIGVFAMYYRQPLSPTDEDIRFIEHAARIASIAIERKRTEEALRRSEQMLRLFIEHSPAAIAMFDRDMKYIVASRRFRLDYELGEQDLAGRSHYEVFPEIQERWKAVHRRCLAGAVERCEEDPFPRSDGRMDWVRWEIRPWHEASGEIGGIILFSEVITERKRAETILRQQEQQLLTDLEAMKRLQAVGTLFVVEGNLQKILDAIVEAAILITGADMGNLQLVDPASGDLRIRAKRGFKPSWVDFWDHAYTGKGACHIALQRGERVIVEDVTTDPIFVGTPALEVQLKAGVRAVQSTPLVSRSGKMLGMFSTHFKIPHRPNERSLRLLDLLARQTADMIERATAEAAIRTQHAELENLYATTPVGLALIDRDLRFVHINKRLAAINGKPVAAHLGRTVAEALPELANTFEPIYRRVLDNGEPVLDVEIHGVTPAAPNVPRDWLASYHPMRAADGSVTGVSIAVLEITERKRAEEILRETQRQLTALIANLPGVVYRCRNDMNWTTEFINESVLQLFGYPAGDFLEHRREIGQLIHPDDRGRVWEEIQAALREHRRYELTYRICTASGAEKWVWEQGTGVFDASGTLQALEGFALDITERKRAEERLRQREHQLSALISNLPGATFRVRNDSNYTAEYVSDQIADITGYPADDFRENRRNFGELMHPDDREWVWNETQKALGEHRPYELTYRFIDAHGRERWNWERGTGIYDANGELQAVEGFVQDITERKKLEESLKHKNIALKETLERLEIEKEDLKNRTFSNIENLLLPAIRKLKRKKVSVIEKKHLDILESNVKEITGTFGQNLGMRFARLSPKEIEVCNMIRAGLTTKDIALTLNISSATVETHRNKIRKKLKISNKDVNLTSFLQML